MDLCERILNPKAWAHDARMDVHRLENYPCFEHILLYNQLYCMHLKYPLTLLRIIFHQKNHETKMLDYHFSMYPLPHALNNIQF